MISAPPEWMTRAACLDVDPEVFFPAHKGDYSRALAICAHCPVRAECAEYAARERYGIWGGLTPADRDPGWLCRRCGRELSTYRQRHCNACRPVVRRAQQRASDRRTGRAS